MIRPIRVMMAFLAITVPGFVTAEPIPLDLLYLARDGEPDRTMAFERLLSQEFRDCTVVPREEFEPRHLDGIDVVLLDWSQRERSGKAVSPIGPLEQWSTPTVLLGSAGLLMADTWQVIGDAG